MTETLVHQQIEAAQQHLDALCQCVKTLPSQQEELLAKPLERFSLVLERLIKIIKELIEQNQEFTAAQRVLKAERQRYQEWFDLAPDGYLTTDPNGLIWEANRAAAALRDRADRPDR
jgi:PAS domain-containing protein